MRGFAALIALAVCLPVSLPAGEKEPRPPKQEYVEFSKLVHGIVVKELPKQFEDASGWGGMTEIPNNLPLMALRKTVKVGDKLCVAIKSIVILAAGIDEHSRAGKLDQRRGALPDIDEM